MKQNIQEWTNGSGFEKYSVNMWDVWAEFK